MIHRLFAKTDKNQLGQSKRNLYSAGVTAYSKFDMNQHAVRVGKVETLAMSANARDRNPQSCRLMFQPHVQETSIRTKLYFDLGYKASIKSQVAF